MMRSLGYIVAPVLLLAACATAPKVSSLPERMECTPITQSKSNGIEARTLSCYGHLDGKPIDLTEVIQVDTRELRDYLRTRVYISIGGDLTLIPKGIESPNHFSPESQCPGIIDPAECLDTLENRGVLMSGSCGDTLNAYFLLRHRVRDAAKNYLLPQ
jgi:hypothetical protein